jgi:hypothetical protein
MNVTIWKLALTVQDTTITSLPTCSDFLCINTQRQRVDGVTRDVPCIWFRVQDTDRMANYQISIVGTGQPANHTLCMQYLGTFQLLDGDFIGHVFIKKL